MPPPKYTRSRQHASPFGEFYPTKVATSSLKISRISYCNTYKIPGYRFVKYFKYKSTSGNSRLSALGGSAHLGGGGAELRCEDEVNASFNFLWDDLRILGGFLGGKPSESGEFPRRYMELTLSIGDW